MKLKQQITKELDGQLYVTQRRLANGDKEYNSLWRLPEHGEYVYLLCKKDDAEFETIGFRVEKEKEPQSCGYLSSFWDDDECENLGDSDFGASYVKPGFFENLVSTTTDWRNFTRLTDAEIIGWLEIE